MIIVRTASQSRTRAGARQPSAAPITRSLPNRGSNGSSASRRPSGVSCSTGAAAAAAFVGSSSQLAPPAAAAAAVSGLVSGVTMVMAPTSARPTSRKGEGEAGNVGRGVRGRQRGTVLRVGVVGIRMGSCHVERSDNAFEVILKALLVSECVRNQSQPDCIAGHQPVSAASTALSGGG